MIKTTLTIAGMAFELVVIVLLSVGFGRYVGHLLGSPSGGLVVGCFLGVGGWCYHLYRTLKKAKNEAPS